MTQLLCPFFRGKPNYKLDSAEEPLWSKSDSEKDDLRCIPRQFTSRTDEASAYEFSTLFLHFHSSSKRGGSSAKSISLTDPPAGLSPPGAAGPYTYEPCDDVAPTPDYENALTD